jgi:hypothetical protein
VPRQNTPRHAVTRYLTPFNEALRCIAQGTLVAALERSYVVGQESSILLNHGDPLRLRTASPPAVYLSLGQRFVVVQDEAIEDGPFRVHTLEYWYQFSLTDGVELLTFHWTPETANRQERRYPHLHIGSGLLATPTPILPGVLHKRHIPTGRVSIESIVRFAIEELGVESLIPNWSDVLDQGQAQFDHYRRK